MYQNKLSFFLYMPVNVGLKLFEQAGTIIITQQVWLQPKITYFIMLGRCIKYKYIGKDPNM